MPCLCTDWYRANAADFDEVSDAQQLAARLEALAVQHEFEQGGLRFQVQQSINCVQPIRRQQL
jgi:hypothetical protein